MSKVFIISLSVLAIGIVSLIVLAGNRPETVQPGEIHNDLGREHLSAGESVDYGGSEPPTSGVHATPVPKGFYEKELKDENIIHNLEHGYVYISYQPDLSEKVINEIRQLFFEPFSNKDFRPNKVIMAPRAANESKIILSSWLRSEKFESYDSDAFMNYYLLNSNKSPEPTAS